MSRIFAAAALATIVLAGSVGLSVAHDESGAESEQMDGIVELFAAGLEPTVVLPIAILAGLALASLGVLARA